MRELRKDPLLDRWVVICSERSLRPSDYLSAEEGLHPAAAGTDPFAAGNEHLTPPEIYALREPGSPPNGPGWQVRVVPNRYPALRVEGELAPRAGGIFAAMNGVGAHEVLIESPDAALTMRDYSLAKIVDVLETLRLRMEDLARDRRMAHVLAFKNHGQGAGATLRHGHCQIVGLPILPLRVQLELQALQAHWNVARESLQRVAVAQEIEAGERMVASTEHAVAFCPYASANQFEVHLYPVQPGGDYRAASRAELHALATLLKTVLLKWQAALGDIPYNLVLRSAPPPGAFCETERSFPDYLACYQWHIEMIPRLGRTAGFEWGSGFTINPVPPEESAQSLRSHAVEVEPA
jgi:UDPglucose--hexose-1-phosphate uridylyltransferase